MTASINPTLSILSTGGDNLKYPPFSLFIINCFVARKEQQANGCYQ
jgi:hypothetical protein